MLICVRCINANPRFVVQSRESPFANAQNPSYAQESAESEDEKQAQLREARASAAEAWSKLDVAVSGLRCLGKLKPLHSNFAVRDASSF
jgi:hypothetical protein